MLRRSIVGALVAAMFGPGSTDIRADLEVNAKIRQEEGENSQIMRTLHFLTDVYGPRLTGSPHLKAAEEWTLQTLRSWGLTNAHLEPFEFGQAGWVNERFSAHLLSPVKDQLTCEVVAWTPGTNGTVTAQAVHIVPPDRPSAADLDAYLESVKDQVKGRIVLAGKSVAVPVNLNPPARRRDDERVRAQFDPNRPPQAPGAGAGPGNASSPAPLTRVQISRRIDEFLVANGALVRVNDAGREHGQIAAFSNSTYDLTKAVPTVVMRNEDFGRIGRILADGTPVELEFTIVNRVHPEGRTAYNAVAELEGTDRKSEIVMLGGHLDSWHSATGATDNAIGCATMMEAVRILAALGLKPRRTIRIALWGGEEQGLLGSQAYVKQHFGTFENPTNGYGKLAAYLNLDSGTGRIRGAQVFGPPEAADVIRQALAPFADLGVAGAIAVATRRLGLTDSGSFNAAGLPGINFVQDPIEYDTNTHHTNLDTYERIVEDDVKSAATEIATIAYELATRDALLPRFPREQMPAAPAR